MASFWKSFFPIFCLNTAICLSLFTIGHFGILPNWVNPNGYAFFASDSFGCHEQALALMEPLSQMNWSAWWEVESRFHTRIASCCYTFWGSWTGYSNLSIWPMNIIALYLTWLGWKRLIVQLGGSSNVPSYVFFLFPILSLHYTQLLRDPLYISIFLWWLNAWLSFFKTTTPTNPWRAWLLLLLLSPLLFWVRERFWVISQVMSLSWLLLGFGLVLIRKHSISWLFGLTILVLSLNAHSIYKYANKNWFKIQEQTGEETLTSKDFVFFYKLAKLRRDFNSSYAQASSIDQHIDFTNDTEVLQYLPRALQVGLFAPFPNMWSDEGGKTGRAGRFLSAYEMIIMWFVMTSCLIIFIIHPKKLEFLFCCSAIVMLCLALGYVVTNTGALYRMRLAAWLIWLALFCSTFMKTKQEKNELSLEMSPPLK